MTRVCRFGRPLPDHYVELAALTGSRLALLDVAAALRDYEVDPRLDAEREAEHGIARATVRRWAERVGLPPRSRTKRIGRLTDDELRRTLRVVREASSYAAAARVLGIHRTSVRGRLAAAGHLTTTTRQEA